MTDSIPTWEELMIPALEILSDGQTHRARHICNAAADTLEISEQDRLELIPSGQPRYLNRSLWALSYLFRAGAVERPVRGQYRIADVGRQLLAQYPQGVTEKDLRELPGYVSPYANQGKTQTPIDEHEPLRMVVPEPTSQLSPTEQVEQAIDSIHGAVAEELLVRLHEQEPAFFEQAVLDLLLAMGYGGAEGRATRTQLSSDGGIDGIIDQDALGLARIYVQAKRYAPDSSVLRPEIQGFVGALHGNQASQGVFITTGRFSRGAIQYADSVATRLVLIDGERLTRLMIKYRVGVQVRQTYHVVELDEDFFQ